MAEIIITSHATEAARIGADAIAGLVERRPDAVLGLATGSSPLALYAELADRVDRGELDLSGVRGFALDEYVGLPPGHRESYREVIRREVVEPLRLTPELVRVPDPQLLPDSPADYERAIVEAGGIDLQVLGIGTDGHVGFNEPGSSLASLTRVKTLTPQTRADNARFFASPDAVPIHCITQGLGTILRARHVVLLAFGIGKARAVAAAVEGPVTSHHPGSIIQLHPRATVIVDEEAASGLEHTDYYKYTWANRLA